MFSRLFPKQFDNNYHGSKLAIWLLVLVVLFKFVIGFNVTGFNPWISNRELVEKADGIPLGTFGTEAASLVMFSLASWGLVLAVLSMLGILILIRYRAMIPLMFLLLAIEQIGRTVGVERINPIVRAVAREALPLSFFINWGFSALLLIGLVLSLAAPSSTAERPNAA